MGLFEKKLLEIIEHCINKGEKELTPSDYGYNSLSLDELDEILKWKSKVGEGLEIEKIYPLSPMQEGMLFHYLSGKDSNTYFEQFSFNLIGKMDIELFNKSFNMLIERYDIFRTIFIHQRVETPKQVVLKERKSDLFFEDISYMNDNEKLKYIEDFKIKDRQSGFNLSKDVPMRLSVFKTASNANKIVWSFQHIIMDGWCTGIIFKEMLRIYQNLEHGETHVLPDVYQYSDYIKWLVKQDNKKAADYWEKYLDGYEELTVIPANHIKKETDSYENREFTFEINRDDTNKIINIAKHNQVTLNTVVQAIWGILLKRYNNSNDVLFGAVVSGRNARVQGIEGMVGLFINTVPVRIKFEEDMIFTDLLKQIQQDSICCKEYEYLSLAKIQSKSSHKQDLINHVVIFENYPIPKEFESISIDNKKHIDMTIDELEVFEQTNYDFNVTVIPGDDIIS